MVNSVNTTLSFKISLKDISFHISINSLGLYLSPKCLLNFLSNLHIPPCVGRMFKFVMLTFLENALNLDIFTHAPLPTHNSPQVLIITHTRHRVITLSPKQHFFENPFLQTAERGGGNYDLLYQNSIRKYEDDLEH